MPVTAPKKTQPLTRKAPSTPAKKARREAETKRDDQQDRNASLEGGGKSWFE